jgi:hypothetical protein
MAQFNQQGQRVDSQYNAGRDMSFGAVQTPEDLVTVLEQLNGEVKKAEDAGVLPEETATDAKYHIAKAASQAKKPDPDKKSIIGYLTAAKTLIAGVTATNDLVHALTTVIEKVPMLHL